MRLKIIAMEDFKNPTFVVFDIETLLDEELLLKTADDPQKYLSGEKFPPFIYHIPITLGVIVTTPDRVHLFKVYHTKKVKPRLIVEVFFQLLGKVRNLCLKTSSGQVQRDGKLLEFPLLVSHNGTRFDIPVLTAHALKHLNLLSPIAREGLKLFLREKEYENRRAAKYTKRYTDFAIDLLDYLPVGLKKLALFFGFKTEIDLDGSKIAELYQRGEHETIAIYCGEDVLITLKVLNRLLEAKGLPAAAEPDDPPELNLFD